VLLDASEAQCTMVLTNVRLAIGPSLLWEQQPRTHCLLASDSFRQGLKTALLARPKYSEQ